MKNRILLSVSFLLIGLSVFAQRSDIDAAKQDLYFLASDELKGREPGTPGAMGAALFIKEVFRSSGLSATNGQGYFQDFPIAVAMETPSEVNSLTLDGISTPPSKTSYPVRYSSNSSCNGVSLNVGFGISASELSHDDYEGKDATGKIVIIDISSPDGIHPHSAYMKYHGLDYRIDNAKEHGAVGVLFLQNDPTSRPPQRVFNSQLQSGLPAWFTADVDTLEDNINLQIEVLEKPKNVTGINVVGFLDRQKTSTLIIGAHYDHLGYGGENSLYRGEPAIHNGADDNASGTTGLLYLARHSENLATRHNLLFIAFSGEERGLLGSDYFSEHPYLDLNDVVAMLNMDMIGRLSEERELLISGTGTANEWDSIIASQNTSDFAISSSKGGTGASDHTSFYQKDIPVLHFFTGTHNDYHKPSDDADKINYEGLIEVVEYLSRIANNIPTNLTFQRTQDSEESTTPRFNVTLGIIPDYIFSGPGIKVDGISEGKPASVAGIQAKDIILKLGEYPVTDIYAYMRALGAYNPGDTIQVTLKRNEKEMKLELTF